VTCNNAPAAAGVFVGDCSLMIMMPFLRPYICTGQTRYTVQYIYHPQITGLSPAAAASFSLQCPSWFWWPHSCCGPAYALASCTCSNVAGNSSQTMQYTDHAIHTTGRNTNCTTGNQRKWLQHAFETPASAETKDARPSCYITLDRSNRKPLAILLCTTGS